METKKGAPFFRPLKKKINIDEGSAESNHDYIEQREELEQSMRLAVGNYANAFQDGKAHIPKEPDAESYALPSSFSAEAKERAKEEAYKRWLAEKNWAREPLTLAMFAFLTSQLGPSSLVQVSVHEDYRRVKADGDWIGLLKVIDSVHLISSHGDNNEGKLTLKISLDDQLASFKMTQGEPVPMYKLRFLRFLQCRNAAQCTKLTPELSARRFLMGLSSEWSGLLLAFKNNLRPWPLTLDDAYTAANTWRVSAPAGQLGHNAKLSSVMLTHDNFSQQSTFVTASSIASSRGRGGGRFGGGGRDGGRGGSAREGRNGRGFERYHDRQEQQYSDHSRQQHNSDGRDNRARYDTQSTAHQSRGGSADSSAQKFQQNQQNLRGGNYRPVTCWNCGDDGHPSTGCPHAPNPNSQHPFRPAHGSWNRHIGSWADRQSQHSDQGSIASTITAASSRQTAAGRGGGRHFPQDARQREQGYNSNERGNNSNQNPSGNHHKNAFVASLTENSDGNDDDSGHAPSYKDSFSVTPQFFTMSAYASAHSSSESVFSSETVLFDTQSGLHLFKNSAMGANYTAPRPCYIKGISNSQLIATQQMDILNFGPVYVHTKRPENGEEKSFDAKCF
jgi:hypothetical protein